MHRKRERERERERERICDKTQEKEIEKINTVRWGERERGR